MTTAKPTTETKHTPGPWTLTKERALVVDGQALEHQAYMVSSAPGCTIVAAVVATKSAANARLIAAAPELLEALRAIEWTAGGANDKHNAFQIINIARAAIAKATA
jgi:hypothetical protein